MTAFNCESIKKATTRPDLFIEINTSFGAFQMQGTPPLGRAYFMTNCGDPKEIADLLAQGIACVVEPHIHPALEAAIQRQATFEQQKDADSDPRGLLLVGKALFEACASVTGAQFIKKHGDLHKRFYNLVIESSRIPLHIATPMRVRQDLLNRILLQISLLGNYTIVSGEHCPFRETWSEKEWLRVCYQRDNRFGSSVQAEPDYHAYEYVIDDPVENVEVFRGLGRRVYRSKNESVYRKLFFTMPNCFTFTYFKPGTEKSIAETSNFEETYHGKPIKALIVTLKKPTLMARYNLLLPPGLYRLERTIFLTFGVGYRTVAIRSGFREKSGLLRYCDYYFKDVTRRSRPHGAIMDVRPPEMHLIERCEPAGNANIFIAMTKAGANSAKLLGFWIGGYGYDACMFTPDLQIDYNSAVSNLANAELKRVPETCTIYEIVRNCATPDDLAESVGAEHFDWVRTTKTCRDWPSDPSHMSNAELLEIERYCATDEVRNSVHVDFLCAATEKNSSVRGVAFYLMAYALIHYWNPGVKSLALYARRWISRQKAAPALAQATLSTLIGAAAGEADQRFTSASVAYFYHRQFGFEIVPRQFRTGAAVIRLDTAPHVHAAALAETGFTYIIDRWFELLIRCQCKYTPEEMVAILPELSNFYSAMLDARNGAGYVDFRRMLDLPMFSKPSFYWQSASDEEECYADAEEKGVHCPVGSGLMFRLCPNIAELGERIDNQFDDLHKRQTWNKSSTDVLPGLALNVSATDAAQMRSVRILEDVDVEPPHSNSDDDRKDWRRILVQRNPNFMIGATEQLDYHPDGTTTSDIFALFDLRQQSLTTKPVQLLEIPAWLKEQSPAKYLKRPEPSFSPIDGQMHFIRRNGSNPIRLLSGKPTQVPQPIESSPVHSPQASPLLHRMQSAAKRKKTGEHCSEASLSAMPKQNRKKARAADSSDDEYSPVE